MDCANRCRARERSHGICADDCDATDIPADQLASSGRLGYGLAKWRVGNGERNSTASKHYFYHTERRPKYIPTSSTGANSKSAECGTPGNDNLHHDHANHCTAIDATG